MVKKSVSSKSSALSSVKRSRGRPRTKVHAPRASNIARRLHTSIGASGTVNFNKNDPFPAMCLKRMVYSTRGQFALTRDGATTFGSGLDQVFNLNSPWDPSTAVTGEGNVSAYGMTEMISLYNRYKVHGVLVEVQFFDPSTDGLVCGLLFNNPSNLSATLAGKSIGAIEKRPMAWASSLANSGSQKLNFKQFFPMYKLFNLTKSQYKNDIENTTSATDNKPATLAQMHINIADATAAASGTVYMNYVIKLTYFTQFYQRKIYTNDDA